MVTIRNILYRADSTYATLSAEVASEKLPCPEFLLWYRFPLEYGDKLYVSGNPFLAAMLMPAMETGEDIHLEGKVSAKLFSGMQTLSLILKKWYPELHLISIHVDGFSIPAKGTRTAAFFSGGVDSFYTVLKNKDKSLNPKFDNNL